MKTCIWCLKNEYETSFSSKAHTIPERLGGKRICINVCNYCNSYFGNPQSGKSSIETILKEAFQVSRVRLLGKENIGKNKILPKYSSEYFKIDLEAHRFSLKPKWQFQKQFLETLGRQFKRGLYKIYLEELERQFGNAIDSKYDFIREFTRYDKGDYPVFYFKREVIFVAEGDLDNPQIFFDKRHETYVHEPHFFEFDLFGHVFGIVISKHYNLTLDSYIKKTIAEKRKFYAGMSEIVKFNDFDITLSILDNA